MAMAANILWREMVHSAFHASALFSAHFQYQKEDEDRFK